MPYGIISKKVLAEKTFEMEIEAPDIARKARPGQFLMIRIDDKGERIPLTIADHSQETVTIVFLVVGKTTLELSEQEEGSSLNDVVGPLGNPSEIEKFGTVCLVGGGLGIAPIYPIAGALKEAGNKVIAVIGAKSRDYLFWQDKLRSVSDELIVCTDDGSYGRKGFVTEALSELLDKEKLDLAYAIGPPIMMKSVCRVTEGRLKTIVSINSIMVDGIGMCGGCRVIIKGESRFACCDGPEFEGHDVDWERMMNRMNMYKEEEKCALGKNGS